MRQVKSVLFFLIAFVLLMPSFKVSANHSWGGYHWARTSNPFVLKVGDNVSLNWDEYLSEASTDWSNSLVLDTNIVLGNGGKNCKPTVGRIEACNRKYGNNGWLGIAQIWLSGEHITQALAKMNDTYFTTRTYNTSSWKRMVMCQEIAHGFGLDHQDEAFDNINLGSCMDYTNNPLGPPSNEHPNTHDFDMLETIYAHLDSFFTSTQDTVFTRLDDPKEWGHKVKDNGMVAVFERNLGNGKKIVTHVIWASL